MKKSNRYRQPRNRRNNSSYHNANRDQEPGKSQGLQYQINMLKAMKSQIREETARAEQRWRLLNIAEASPIHNVHLVNFGIADKGDNVKEYYAYCSDKRHPFRISVKKNASSICEIILVIPSDSPLIEIKTVLDKLSEKLCPNRVLLTIQQFSHMTNFREMVTGRLPSKHFKHAIIPSFEQGQYSYTIWARDTLETLELQWTFVWDESYHALAHSFIVIRDVKSAVMRNFLQQLQNTFYSGKEEVLSKLWSEFSERIAMPQVCYF